MLTVEELQHQVDDREIDTVQLVFTYLYRSFLWKSVLTQNFCWKW
jgi:hypothetical protein